MEYLNKYDKNETISIFKRAFETRDLKTFMDLVFPDVWKSIGSRIIESGAMMSNDMHPWAPKWSLISPTIKYGNNKLHTWVKSCIFRAHDCIHQLWGLPLPDTSFSEESFYIYKRAQMCGEVAVLTLIEFSLCKYIFDAHPSLRDLILERNAIKMMNGPLKNKSVLQIAIRLDSLLHKKIRPKWVRDNEPSIKFCDDYVPMLETDRKYIDHNWKLMQSNNWRPTKAPNVRYNSGLDGLELTIWMINDFFHLIDTDHEIDDLLSSFNKSRRKDINLPVGWNSPIS